MFTAVIAFLFVTEKVNGCKITHSILLRLLIIAISTTCEHLTKSYLIKLLDAYQPLSGKSRTISRNSQITWHQTMKHQLVLKQRRDCQWARTIQGRVDTKWRKETFPAAVLKEQLWYLPLCLAPISSIQRLNCEWWLFREGCVGMFLSPFISSPIKSLALSSPQPFHSWGHELWTKGHSCFLKFWELLFYALSQTQSLRFPWEAWRVTKVISLPPSTKVLFYSFALSIWESYAQKKSPKVLFWATIRF